MRHPRRINRFAVEVCDHIRTVSLVRGNTEIWASYTHTNKNNEGVLTLRKLATWSEEQEVFIEKPFSLQDLQEHRETIRLLVDKMGLSGTVQLDHDKSTHIVHRGVQK